MTNEEYQKEVIKDLKEMISQRDGKIKGLEGSEEQKIKIIEGLKSKLLNAADDRADWYCRFVTLREALEHYANRDHWGTVTTTAYKDWYQPERNGWTIAEKALEDTDYD